MVNPSYLGVSGYVLQTVGNAIAMVSATIAAALYGNIGVKGTSLKCLENVRCVLTGLVISHLQQHLC